MINGFDIVIVGLQPWDIAIGSNCKNIAMEFAKMNRVLYVNPPLDRNTYHKGKGESLVRFRKDVIRGKEEGLVKISDNLWNLYPNTIAESINWINNKSIFNWFNKMNNRRLADNIKSAMKQIGMKHFILFNDQSMIRCYHLQEFLLPDLFVYYIRDNLKTIEYFKKHALELQERLISKADVVATNSEYLASYAREFNPSSSFVGQGCDFSLYKSPEKLPVAGELLHLSRPIIGYTGFLTSVRLDIKLLEFIAIQKPDWQIVLVGPEDDDFKSSSLHEMRNVHFLGNKSPDSLPGFINGFDVAINPQLVNEVTMGNYPRKIDEYLAMGKPVVATYTPFMDYFKDYTYLADTHIRFKELIAVAIKENTPFLEKQRRDFAFTHTWEANVATISNLIEQKLDINVEKPA